MSFFHLSMFYLLNLVSVVQAASIERRDWQLVAGRDPHRLVVKFHEGSDWSTAHIPSVLMDERLTIQAMFSQDTVWLAGQYARLRKHSDVEDLTTYLQIEADAAVLDALARRLAEQPEVEHVYRAFLPQSPPMDIPPETPDFFGYQLDHLAQPTGLGFEKVRQWTAGAGMRVANIEYSYDPLHEDLERAPVTHAWGWDPEEWAYHGNAVIGQLIATDNLYGVVGAIPETEVLVISPYDNPNWYTVSNAILSAVDFLSEGDVILIEQQTARSGAYCPMEYEPSVFDAIQWATAMGITVVEPGGNGAQNLDTSVWDDWFNLDVQDSGAIMVGGSQANVAPLMWTGSSFGSRIDVQGWYQDITTTSAEQYGDLFLPQGDSLQAYTQYFGGTSGASPQIVSIVIALNAMAIQQGNDPYSPAQLREILRQTGRSQPVADQDRWIGNQPDIETLIRMWAW